MDNQVKNKKCTEVNKQDFTESCENVDLHYLSKIEPGSFFFLSKDKIKDL